MANNGHAVHICWMEMLLLELLLIRGFAKIRGNIRIGGGKGEGEKGRSTPDVTMKWPSVKSSNLQGFVLPCL